MANRRAPDARHVCRPLITDALVRLRLTLSVARQSPVPGQYNIGNCFQYFNDIDRYTGLWLKQAETGEILICAGHINAEKNSEGQSLSTVQDGTLVKKVKTIDS